MFSAKRSTKEQQEQTLQRTEETLNKTEQLQKELTAQNTLLQKQQAFLDKLGKQHQAVLESLSQEVDNLHDLGKAGAAEVHNLKTAKIELKTTVTDRFSQQLTKSLHAMEKEVQTDTTKIERLSTELIHLTKDLQDAKTVINQFKSLASTIKDTDYDIKEYAKALKQSDQEKLQLMKRIDELETMIAKFKRGPRRPY